MVFERRRIRGQVDGGGLGKGRQNHPAGYSHLLDEATDCDGVPPPPPPPPLFSSSTPRATPPPRVAPAQGLFAPCWNGRCCHRDAGRSVAELTQLELISRAFYFREVSRKCARVEFDEGNSILEERERGREREILGSRRCLGIPYTLIRYSVAQGLGYWSELFRESFGEWICHLTNESIFSLENFKRAHKLGRGCILLLRFQYASVKGNTSRPVIFLASLSPVGNTVALRVTNKVPFFRHSVYLSPSTSKRFAYCHALTGAWALARIISRRGRRKHIYRGTGRGTNALICAENRPCPEIKGRDKSISRAAKCFPNLSRPFSPLYTPPFSSNNFFFPWVATLHKRYTSLSFSLSFFLWYRQLDAFLSFPSFPSR